MPQIPSNHRRQGPSEVEVSGTAQRAKRHRGPRLAGEDLLVMDGPFTEAKEVIGWAPKQPNPKPSSIE